VCACYTARVPNVVILAGPNGAGKSTAAPVVVHELMAVGAFVNADVIARGLAGFDTESVDRQAGRIMLERLRELAAQRADFAFETTLASRSFAPFLKQLIADGYRVSLVYVWLNSPDLCVSRVAARGRSGGHTVDEEIVRRRYLRSLNNFFGLYQPLADEWQVYDNSGSSRARPVAEGRHTEAVSVHDAPTWGQMLRRAGREHQR
jgi:predicted ABC-type ATPase